MIRILWVKRSLHARMLTPSKLLGAATGRCLYKGGQGSPPAAIPPPPPAPSPQPHHRHHVGVGRPGHHLHDQDHQVRQSHQDPQRCMNKILSRTPFGAKCSQFTLHYSANNEGCVEKVHNMQRFQQAWGYKL